MLSSLVCVCYKTCLEYVSVWLSGNEQHISIIHHSAAMFDKIETFDEYNAKGDL